MALDTRKFEDALNVLNEAARERKDELRGLLNDKYTEIRTLMDETLARQRGNYEQARRVAEDWIEDGGERVREAVADIDDKVHENPWPYIGGVAVGAVLLGFILGSSSRNK
jgi:ElaB/YqjD/DUF883 family membrane-anchored ribosome-binding protein